MKPIAIKIYLVQILLIVLASSFAFLSIGVADYNIAFWNASWGNLVHGEAKIPVILGVVPFSNLSLFLSFLFTYLVFEFYGLKTAIYTSLAIAMVMLLQFYLFFTLQTLKPVGVDNHLLLTTLPLSYLNQKAVHALAAAISLGFSSIFILAWLLKKLTKDYFMFFRFFIASSLGFALFVFVRTYIQKMNELGQMSILMESFTPALQFATLTLASIIPLYLLRLILGFFRGRGISGEDHFVGAGKPLFKGRAPKAVPPADKTPIDIAPPDEEEITHDRH